MTISWIARHSFIPHSQVQDRLLLPSATNLDFLESLSNQKQSSLMSLQTQSETQTLKVSKF